MSWNTEPRAARGTIFAGFALLGIAFSACAPRPDARPGAVAAWERAVLGDSRARLPAQAEGPRCLVDRLRSPASLREEITRLEREREDGGRIAGAWRGIDLAALPRAQAAFLSRFGDTVPAAVDVGGCADLICVLTRVYGGDEASALLAYGWYLRMGYLLGHDTDLPGIAPVPGLGHESYRFRPEDLRLLWRLGHLLPPGYRHLSALDGGLHRLPSGYQIPGSEWACGVRYGTNRSGHILITDACLQASDGVSLGGDVDREGHFLVIHELTHAYDAALGTDRRRLAETDEWMSLSGWKLQEAVLNGVELCELEDRERRKKCAGDAVGQPNEACAKESDAKKQACLAVADPKRRILRQDWSHDPARGTFVSDYARTNAIEDLAETVPAVRLNAAGAFKRAPEKAAFVTERILGGRRHDLEGTLAAYVAAARERAAAGLPTRIDRCFEHPDERAPGAGPSPREAFDLGPAVRPEIRDCIGAAVEAAIDAELEDLRRSELDACPMLAGGNDAVVRRRARAAITPELQALVSRNAAVADQIRELATLRERLEEELDPREAWLACHDAEAPEACHARALGEGFDRLAAELRHASAEAVSAERERYLRERGVPHARAALLEIFGRIFAGVERPLDKAADRRWEMCLAEDAAAAAPPALLTEPFAGGERFVSAPILNCVNAAARPEVDDVIGRFAAKLGFSVSAPGARSFVHALLMPRYLARLQARLERAASEEQAAREARGRSFAAQQVGRLAAEASVWLGQPPAFGAAARRACDERAAAAFDADAHALAPLTRFVAPEDLRRDWTEAACDVALKASEVTALTEPARRAAFAAALPALETRLIEVSDPRGEGCAARYPGRTPAARGGRSGCLKSASGWNELEAATLREWLAEPAQADFAPLAADARRHLEKARRETQARAVERMESRLAAGTH